MTVVYTIISHVVSSEEYSENILDKENFQSDAHFYLLRFCAQPFFVGGGGGGMGICFTDCLSFLNLHEMVTCSLS